MLTRFITSQHDHGGYLCMGINNSLRLQESRHLPPLLVGQTLESLARVTTPPCLPFFLALPLFLPILPLHSPSMRGTTESQAQLSQKHRSQTPSLTKLQYSQAAWFLGSRTAFAWSQLQQRERQWQRAYRRRPTALETQEKRQRQKHAHGWQHFTRAQFQGGQFPAKFGCQPIKLELYPLAHTYPANCVRVHFRHLGVYKESRVAYRAIRVRVS